MNFPFPPPDGPFSGRPFPGPQPGTPFGCDPHDRRALHEQRRAAHREMRDQLREQRSGDTGFGFGPGFGFGGFGPGFGPGPFGAGGPRGRGGRRSAGRGRGRRGDVRAAILKLLTERPMHGYEMTQEIAARSDSLWKPSPGSIYPTLQLLVDEGLIVPAESRGSKKTFELTTEGRAAADAIETPPWEEIAQDVDPAAVNLRSAVGQLLGAVGQSLHIANAAQQQRILDIVNNARREIYQILGEE